MGVKEQEGCAKSFVKFWERMALTSTNLDSTALMAQIQWVGKYQDFIENFTHWYLTPNALTTVPQSLASISVCAFDEEHQMSKVWRASYWNKYNSYASTVSRHSGSCKLFFMVLANTQLNICNTGMKVQQTGRIILKSGREWWTKLQWACYTVFIYFKRKNGFSS